MSTPTTPKTPIPPTLPAGITKICHIVKRDDFDGYGFNLHSEKTKPGQFIGKVDPKSPAEAAGLKEGDRILEVNGVSIGSETHKQVVARIKAIACEVRLLLIDVDGKGDEAMAMVKAMNGNVACANDEKSESKAEQCERNSSSDNGGIKQEMPGASANISSISMVSTKRASNSSVSNQSGSSTLNMDMVDKAAVPATQQHNGFSVEKHTKDEQQQQQQMMMIEKTAAINNNNNNTLMTTPPPPSAAVAMPNNNKNNNMIYSTTTTTTTKTATTNGNGHGIVAGNNTPPTTPPSPSSPSITTTTTTTTAAAATRPGGLNLPLTAAEMRAKLASKKKYDPKNESVDLKKKFEIIQKL